MAGNSVFSQIAAAANINDRVMVFIELAGGNDGLNTLIPLDMVFIDAEARLVSIQREAEPLSQTSRPSEGPARFVLEIDGGEAAALGINADTVFEFGPKTVDYLERLDGLLGN